MLCSPGYAIKCLINIILLCSWLYRQGLPTMCHQLSSRSLLAVAVTSLPASVLTMCLAYPPLEKPQDKVRFDLWST